MKWSGALPIVFWGLLLTILGAVAVIAFADGLNVEVPTLLGGCAAAMFLAGGFIAAVGFDRQRVARHASPDTSPATVWLAVAVAMTALGAELGWWLALIGAGMAGVGLAGVYRELRAERRAISRGPS
jgi:predicted tellurium resistance membrane protein TerC